MFKIISRFQCCSKPFFKNSSVKYLLKTSFYFEKKYYCPFFLHAPLKRNLIFSPTFCPLWQEIDRWINTTGISSYFQFTEYLDAIKQISFTAPFNNMFFKIINFCPRSFLNYISGYQEFWQSLSWTVSNYKLSGRLPKLTNYTLFSAKNKKA